VKSFDGLCVYNAQENGQMKKLTLVISLGSLFAAAAFADSWSGTISDSKCGAKHEAATAADAACAKKCVNGGASAVLVTGGQVYKIADDSQARVTPLLGKKVTVMGMLNGDTIEVTSAKAAKE
jgi:hypothetical protein